MYSALERDHSFGPALLLRRARCPGRRAQGPGVVDGLDTLANVEKLDALIDWLAAIAEVDRLEAFIDGLKALACVDRFEALIDGLESLANV
jgi:hypothetical protein